jgi:hypothetical protein
VTFPGRPSRTSATALCIGGRERVRLTRPGVVDHCAAACNFEPSPRRPAHCASLHPPRPACSRTRKFRPRSASYPWGATKPVRGDVLSGGSTLPRPGPPQALWAGIPHSSTQPALARLGIVIGAGRLPECLSFTRWTRPRRHDDAHRLGQQDGRRDVSLGSRRASRTRPVAAGERRTNCLDDVLGRTLPTLPRYETLRSVPLRRNLGADRWSALFTAVYGTPTK